MKFDFNMPVEIMSGTDCVKNNVKTFNLGKKCLIVTGRRSAVASGALDDVKSVLDENGAEYTVYDKITENPLLSVCFEGGRTAIGFDADFVIGIGGGSVLDAAKAIAAFAAKTGRITALGIGQEMQFRIKCSGRYGVKALFAV